MQFWKMNGAGNDFIILNNIQEGLPAEAFPVLARTLCTPHRSLGADGFMVVEPAQGGGGLPDALLQQRRLRSGGEARQPPPATATRATSDPPNGGTPRGGRHRGEDRGRSPHGAPAPPSTHPPPPCGEEAEGGVLGLRLCGAGPPRAARGGGPPGGAGEIPKAFSGWGRAGEPPRFPKGANVNFYEVTGPNQVLEKTYERGVEDFTWPAAPAPAAWSRCSPFWVRSAVRGSK